MVVLDTDVLALIQRRSGNEYQRLVGRLAATDPRLVHVTVISLEEQTRGWLAYISRARTASVRPFLHFDLNAARCFERLAKLRLRVGTMDLKLAAIAIANNATLISRNAKDFNRVPDLIFEDWTLR